MNKPTTDKPTRSSFTLLRQLCNLIPNHLVPQLARDTGVDTQARTFRPWSHVVSLLYAQLTHALSLNDVCDALRLHAGPLSAIRAATPASKNALSHANRQRDPIMAEHLFWAMLDHLQQLHPGFGARRRPKFAFRFKRLIHVVDSTTIQLVARCLDWAKHRRRKAAAKCHVRLNLQTFLPRFAIVDTAGEHDNRRAHELCAGVAAGEIVIFDKAYVDFSHLADLSMREVFWVTRAKDNLRARVWRKLQSGRDGRIRRDDLIQLTSGPSRKAYPVEVRRVVALVEVDGEIREMVFLTNNLTWSAQTIADLYRCRWSYRGLLQGTETVAPVGGLPRPQRPRGAVAGVDGAAGVSAVALLRFPEPVEPQLHPSLHTAARRVVAATGFAQLARPLWDSRWRRTLLGHT